VLPLVYRCMVWHKAGFDGPPSGWSVYDGMTRSGIPSGAYGEFEEHATIDAAMHDMIALKLTSMKHSHPGGAFWATVCEFPKGKPPVSSRRTIYMVLGE
jgi:hypothetical protein